MKHNITKVGATIRQAEYASIVTKQIKTVPTKIQTQQQHGACIEKTSASTNSHKNCVPTLTSSASGELYDTEKNRLIKMSCT